MNYFGQERRGEDPMEELIKQEQQIDRYIKQGQKKLAIKSLYDLIITSAKAKKFALAESLRERLIQIDNMAVSEIVHSAEIIEAAKAETIDIQQRMLWKQLYDSLSLEESNAFFLSLKQATVPPDCTIIRQAMLNDKLFFIKKGRLNLIYSQGDEDIFVKQINKGETVAQDTFFSISLCTYSVITVNSVQLVYLDHATLRKLEKQFPGFENKLHEFCLHSEEKVVDILKKRDIERRRFKRFKVAGTISTQPLDKKGLAMESMFHGHLEDICQGGVSYLIKCSQKASARSLLGRPVQVNLSLLKDGCHKKVKIKGLIVAVKFRCFNDYMAHIKFFEHLPEARIRELSFSSKTAERLINSYL